jgi:hypothetical protein
MKEHKNKQSESSSVSSGKSKGDRSPARTGVSSKSVRAGASLSLQPRKKEKKHYSKGKRLGSIAELGGSVAKYQRLTPLKIDKVRWE